jgi:hypothetical protein
MMALARGDVDLDQRHRPVRAVTSGQQHLDRADDPCGEHADDPSG